MEYDKLHTQTADLLTIKNVTGKSLKEKAI